MLGSEYHVRRVIYEGPRGTHIRYAVARSNSSQSPVTSGILYLLGLVVVAWILGWWQVPPFEVGNHKGPAMFHGFEMVERSDKAVRKDSSSSSGIQNISEHLRYGGGRRGRKRGGYQHAMNLTLQRAVQDLVMT